MIKPGKRRSTVELIRGLREMHGLARAGLILTARDLSLLDEAADRLEEMDERIDIMAADMDDDYKAHTGLLTED